MKPQNFGSIGDFKRQLEGLKKSVRNTILRQAMRKATAIVVKAAKSKVPTRTGLLKKSIGAKVKMYKSGEVVGIVGPRSGFKKKVVLLGRRGAILGTKKAGKLLAAGGKEAMQNPTRYAHLVEDGSRHASPHPFLRPALASSKSAVKAAMAQAIRDGLERVARKG